MPDRETPLREFVENALTEITIGVSKAQENVKDYGGILGPRTSLVADKDFYDVEFDIAVTSREDDEAKAGLGVFLANVGIGGQASASSSREGLNRIRFSVPLRYPKQRRKPGT